MPVFPATVKPDTENQGYFHIAKPFALRTDRAMTLAEMQDTKKALEEVIEIVLREHS